MLKQVLIYTNSDLYKHGCLDLVHQRFFTSTPDADSDIDYYISQYRNKFTNKKYSEIHILMLHLDPANGITEVLMNEYAQHPVKVKTIINAAAATARKTVKMSWDEAIAASPSFDDPDEEHEEEEHE